MDYHLQRALHYERETPDGDRSFQYWMADVDRCIEGLIGLSAYDLEEANYRSLFETGLDPSEAARHVLEENGLFPS
jgi:hypothetical protein